ncbi:MAG: PadR family transcriptional regulator [Eubacterium sp.]|nr:PadR family transcriptional regulator [Eubacterium sp.]
MDAHIKKVYVPMTETGFYILLCLREEMHGYGIVQKVEALTKGAVKISPGTMYGSLSKMEKDGIIRFVREEDKRKIYRITDLGMQVLNLEMTRIKRLYQNMLEVREYDEKRVQVFYGSAMEKGGGIPEAAT